MMESRPTRHGAVWHALAGLLALASIASWTLLFVSLEGGRTTPASVSLAWLITFGVVAFLLLAWLGAYGLLLRRLSRGDGATVLGRCALSASPLLLSLPCLLGVYGSDQLFHSLLSNSISAALVLWIPIGVSLACQEVIIVWSTRFPAGADRWLSRGKAAPILIFAAFAILYVFTAGGHLYSPDEREMYQITESITHGSVATSFTGGAAEEENGTRRWSKYGLVPSLLAVPPYWVAESLGLQPDPPSAAFPIPNGAHPIVDLLINPLLTAATCALLYAVGLRLGFRQSTSLMLAVAYGLGTSAWVYSKTFFTQPAAALFLLGAAYALLGNGRSRPRDYGVGGIMLGLAVGSRFEVGLFALPLLGLLARPAREDFRNWLKQVAFFALLFLVTGGLTAGWYNYVKTGSVLLTGYGDQGTLAGFSPKPYIGLFGTFLSSGFGFFVYNPLAAIGVFSLPLLAAKRRLEASLFAISILLAVILYGCFKDWFGGFTWANRYMLVVLPLAILPAGALLERPWRTHISAVLVYSSVLLGGVINLLGVLFDFNNGWLDLWDHHASLAQIQWDPHFSPIGAHLRLLENFLATGSKLDLYIFYRLGMPSLLLFMVLFLLLITLAARAALTSDPAAERRVL
jgi:hypothetical protein